MQRSVLFCMAVWLAVAIPATNAWSQGGALIRDAEIESTIRNLSAPLLRAAGLPPGDVRIHIVRNDSLNAFVAGGLQIFIYTGLLQRTETPNQLAGVIAHEIGHISGGHLARTREELRGASAASILAAVLGVAAAVASGDARVGSAVIMGGQSAVQRNILKYSRTQESAADQAALQLLDATGQSATGLSEFLDIIGDQELLLSSQQAPYLRTHPFSRDRVEAIEGHLAQSPYTDKEAAAEVQKAHARMRAKISGFLDPTGRVLRKYPESDTSLPAVYARAVAYHRDGNFSATDAAISRLLEMSPDDPYFHELKGQLLFERADNAGAIAAYRKAVTESGAEPLIVFGYARAVIAAPSSGLLDDAIERLESALVREPDNGTGWRLLGTAYGKQGDLGQAALALAESEWHFGNPELTVRQARRAQSKLTRGSPEWLRAEDLRLAAERRLMERNSR